MFGHRGNLNLEKKYQKTVQTMFRKTSETAHIMYKATVLDSCEQPASAVVVHWEE